MIYTNDDSRIKNSLSFRLSHIPEGMSLRSFVDTLNDNHSVDVLFCDVNASGLVLIYNDIKACERCSHIMEEYAMNDKTELFGEYVYNNTGNIFCNTEQLVIISKEQYLEAKEFLKYKEDFKEYLEYKEEFIKYKNSYRGKVPPKKRKEIREKYKKGKVSYHDLAEEYGVCKTTIYNVIKKH